MASYFKGKVVEKLNRHGKNVTALVQDGKIKWTGVEAIELSLTYTTDAGTFKKVFETINDFKSFISSNQASMHTSIKGFNNRTDLGSYTLADVFQGFKPAKETYIDFSKFNAVQCTSLRNFLNMGAGAETKILEFKMPYNTENVTTMWNFCNNARSCLVDFSKNVFLKCSSWNYFMAYNLAITELVINSPNPFSFYFNYMCREAINLESIDFSNFNVSIGNVTNSTYVFFNCKSVTTAYAMDSAQAAKLNDLPSAPSNIKFVVKPSVALMSLGIQSLGNMEDDQQQLNEMGVMN